MSIKAAIILPLVLGVVSVKLPADFLICKASQPNLDKCVKDAIEVAFPKLANGIKQLDLPPLEPLTIPSAVIQGSGGPVHLTQKFKNFEIHNIVSTKVVKYSGVITPKSYTGDMHMLAPEYKIKADYDFNGRVLLLPIVGHGKCTVTLKDINLHMHLFGNMVTKKDKPYLNLTVFDLKLSPGKVVFQFDNLFNGNKVLGDQMNTLLNDNWKDVFEDVKAGYEEVLGTVFKNYARIIFGKVPWQDLYP